MEKFQHRNRIKAARTIQKLQKLKHTHTQNENSWMTKQKNRENVGKDGELAERTIEIIKINN